MGKFCTNCKYNNHNAPDCYSKGDAKEGQSPWARKKVNAAAADSKSTEAKVNVALAAIVEILDEESETTEDITAAAAKSPYIETIVDPGASIHICLDKSKYITFRTIKPVPIVLAEGHRFSTVGQDNIHLELAKGPGKASMSVVLKNTLYTPGTAVATGEKPNLSGLIA